MAEFYSISIENWLVMAALGFLSAFFGFLPYFLLRRLKSWQHVRKNNVYHLTISALSCLGAGVLLSTTIAHMLPENRTSLESTQYVQENFDPHFPLAEMLTLCGFLLIYFLEEFGNFMMGGHGTVLGHSHSSGANCHAPHDVQRTRKASTTSTNVMYPATVLVGISVEDPSPPESTTNSQSQLAETSYPKKEVRASQIGAFFAVFALCFHAVMEGLAIGLQNSSNLWLMFGAIAGHKFIISFCMGMELCAVRTNTKVYVGSVTLFSILSPVGILIGSLLTSEDSTKSFPLGVLEGIATGTLLYIIFMEILSREKERRANELATSRSAGFLQFTALMIGLVAMLCLLTLTSHGHSHDDGGHTHEPGDDHDDGHDHEGDYEDEHDHDDHSLKFKLYY